MLCINEEEESLVARHYHPIFLWFCGSSDLFFWRAFLMLMCCFSSFLKKKKLKQLKILCVIFYDSS